LVVFGPATSSDVEFMLSSSSSTSSTTESVAESASPECTDLLNQISSLCVQFLGKAGKEIPPQWHISDLLQTVVIGEEDMEVIRPFLVDTYYDLALHGPNSWVVIEIMAWIDLVNYAPPLVRLSLGIHCSFWIRTTSTTLILLTKKRDT